MRTALFSEREREILEECDRTGVEPNTQFFRTLKSRIKNSDQLFWDYRLFVEVKARIEGLKK